MFYPEDFKNRVKKAYPDWEELYQALEIGDEYAVGRALCDSMRPAMPLDTILKATSLEELQKQARTEQEKVELYSEWYRLDREQSA